MSETTTSPRRTIDMVIHGVADGYHVEFALSLAIDDLPVALARLRAAGVDPTPSTLAGATRPTSPARAPRVTPTYSGDGPPICPTHGKPLREGRFGLYCSAPDPDGKNGYCSLKFAN